MMNQDGSMLSCDVRTIRTVRAGKIEVYQRTPYESVNLSRILSALGQPHIVRDSQGILLWHCGCIATPQWQEQSSTNARCVAPGTRICDYCHDAPAEGYVKAYRAWVCEDCYEDHHGPCC